MFYQVIGCALKFRKILRVNAVVASQDHDWNRFWNSRFDRTMGFVVNSCIPRSSKTTSTPGLASRLIVWPENWNCF
jgi:hypothetical protein